MALVPRPAPFGDAWSDMIGFVFQRRPHQYVFAALSVAIPALTFYAFVDEFTREKEYQAPPVIYMKQWSADRTVAEIKAQQMRDLPGELAAKKAEADALEKNRAVFRRLQKQFKSIGG